MESEFTAVLAAGFAHYTKLFGGLPRDLEGNPYKEVTIRVRHGTLSGEADPRLIILSWNDKTVGYGTWKTMLLHELLHLWCAESFRYASGSEQWFNEGFTGYFAIRTATQLGYIDNEDALAIAALPVGYYTSAKNLGALSLREVGENDKLKFQNYFLLYHGGWVVAMLLDENIRTRSNGEKSLEDLMRWMHRNFPRHEQLAGMPMQSQQHNKNRQFAPTVPDAKTAARLRRRCLRR